MYNDWNTSKTVLLNSYRSYLLLLYWPHLQMRKTRSRWANFWKTAVNTSPLQMSRKRWQQKDKQISILFHQITWDRKCTGINKSGIRTETHQLKSQLNSLQLNLFLAVLDHCCHKHFTCSKIYALVYQLIWSVRPFCWKCDCVECVLQLVGNFLPRTSLTFCIVCWFPVAAKTESGQPWRIWLSFCNFPEKIWTIKHVGLVLFYHTVALFFCKFNQFHFQKYHAS